MTQQKSGQNPASSPRPPPTLAGQTGTNSAPTTKRIWTVEDLREISAMVVRDSPALLRETDRRGLGPIQFAAFQSAIATDALMPLLALLEPQGEELSKIDTLVSAIEAVMDTQKLILAGQAMIIASQKALASQLADLVRRVNA